MTYKAELLHLRAEKSPRGNNFGRQPGAIIALMTTTNDRAIFFDKDGIFVEGPRRRAEPAATGVRPRAAEGLVKLREAGYRLFIVASEPGVAHGKYRESALEPMVRRFEELLEAKDVAIDGFYYCPHDPEGRVRAYAVACGCRRPEPGLIEDACREHGLDPLRSWMVGSLLDDVEAGRRAGCRTVLLDDGRETEWREGPQREPHIKARDAMTAADLILARERAEGHQVSQRLHGRDRVAPERAGLAGQDVG